MTRKEAWEEADELLIRQYMWRLPLAMTPYQREVRLRYFALDRFVRNGGQMPVERSEWRCPPRDVEETVELFYFNSYPHRPGLENLWKVRMAEAGGKLPPLPEYTDDLVERWGP